MYFTAHQVTHNLHVTRMGKFETKEEAIQRVIDEHPENKRDFVRYVVLNNKGFRVFEVQGGASNPYANPEIGGIGMNNLVKDLEDRAKRAMQDCIELGLDDVVKHASETARIMEADGHTYGQATMHAAYLMETAVDTELAS